MSNELLRQAMDLGEDVGSFPSEAIEDNPGAALEIIAHCLALPELESQALRHKVGNEILANVRRHFSYSYHAPFRNVISNWVGERRSCLSLLSILT